MSAHRAASLATRQRGGSHVLIPFMKLVPLENQYEHLRFAVAFALRGFKIKSDKYKLTEAERYEIGDRVVAHISQTSWQIWREDHPMHTAGGPYVPPKDD